MKLLRREITIRRASRQLFQKQVRPDKNRIATLTGEIFELQRIILMKSQAKELPAAV
jgi:hypothetical protein